MSKKHRGVILFDGDNIIATVRERIGLRQPDFGRLARYLQGRYGIDKLVQATVFVSAKPGTELAWRKTLTEEGVLARIFTIQDGHGYPDSEIVDQAIRLAKRFDTLVLVSSDNDFWDLATALKAQGKKVVAVGCSGNINPHWEDAFSDTYYLEDAIYMASQGVETPPLTI